MKKRKSITLDPNISKLIEQKAAVEHRSFSNMVEYMAKIYLKLENNGLKTRTP